MYGHRCEVYTDHEALLSLINYHHPSGKLAHWGLVLQELDLIIHYQPSRFNQTAVSLSGCSGNASECVDTEPQLKVASEDLQDT